MHRYLLDEAAGTDARGPDESPLTPVRRECELIRQPRELDGGLPGTVRYPVRTSGLLGGGRRVCAQVD